jgi:polar amino acid transport system substrate-binding protein
LISYLAGSEVACIQTVAIPLDSDTIQSEDNIIVNLSFKNGSIGVLSYISIGGSEMEKERIEIFTKRSSMVINDFKELLMFNTGEKDIKLKEADKGHSIEMEEFAKLIQGKTSLIQPFATDILMTRHTLDILREIHVASIG